MLERNFQVEFGKWIKENMPTSAVFELKSARGSSLPFLALKEHQEQALLHAKHNKIYFKIPDVGFQNPFDCFVVVAVPAFVVIRYGSGRFYIIDIDDFVKEKAQSERSSLTEERAKEIASMKS